MRILNLLQQIGLSMHLVGLLILVIALLLCAASVIQTKSASIVYSRVSGQHFHEGILLDSGRFEFRWGERRATSLAEPAKQSRRVIALGKGPSGTTGTWLRVLDLWTEQAADHGKPAMEYRVLIIHWGLIAAGGATLSVIPLLPPASRWFILSGYAGVVRVIGRSLKVLGHRKPPRGFELGEHSSPN